MTALGRMKSQPLFVEFGQHTLSLFNGTEGVEIPIERLETGQLSESCKERLSGEIREFQAKKNWSRRQRAVCAIGARGVSLRRLTLPSSTKEELDRLVRMQVESEFPLPPEELAWGYEPVKRQGANGEDAKAINELVVVAVKKGMIEDYSEVLSKCGLEPVFTLGAVARASICVNRPASYSVLEIGCEQSELISYENGVMTSVRMLPWGTNRVTDAVEEGLGLARNEAEETISGLIRGGNSDPNEGKVLEIIRGETNVLSRSISRNGAGSKVFVTGRTVFLAMVTRQLAEALRGVSECERIDLTAGDGRTAATMGLMRRFEPDGDGRLLELQVRRAEPSPTGIGRRSFWNWVLLAGLLGITALGFRYVEAYLKQPGLAGRVREIRLEQAELPDIDHELGFLQFLETNRAPYLSALAVLAEASGRGTRVESISLNRRGDLSLRGTMQNSQQATDFRNKLVESGMFGAVSVEEQSPDKNKRNVAVRITARWNLNRPPQSKSGVEGSGSAKDEIQTSRKQPVAK